MKAEIEEVDMISITIDIDWAHNEVLEKCASILDEYGINATFFCTHKHDIHIGNNHELAIHPNYNCNESYEETIGKLMKLYPQANGVRSHGLYSYYKLYSIYEEYGLRYESNYFMYKQANIAPFKTLNNILQLPIFFSDGSHTVMSGNNNFKLEQFNLKDRGLKVFLFHPIHIFLNTNDLKIYQRAKKYYHEPDKLKNFYNEDDGTRSLFTRLLDYINANSIKTYTMEEINNIWRSTISDS
jgi:hypothetical protein